MFLYNLSHCQNATLDLRTVIKRLEEPNRFFCTVRQMMTLQILQYSYSLTTGFSNCELFNYFNTVDR